MSSSQSKTIFQLRQEVVKLSKYKEISRQRYRKIKALLANIEELKKSKADIMRGYAELEAINQRLGDRLERLPFIEYNDWPPRKVLDPTPMTMIVGNGKGFWAWVRRRFT